MDKFSAKNKIFALTAVWIVLSALMFTYFFNLLDASNQQTVVSMDQQKSDLAALTAESQSYNQAQADLKELAGETYQPDNFFSKDITLVDEISVLENWGQKLGVQIQLAGIAGTVDNASMAQTATPIVTVPYSITLSGGFTQIVQYLEVLENLGFVTNITSISFSAGDKNSVNANLGGVFYLKK